MQTLEQLNAGALRGSKRIKLSAGLTEIPAEIFELADTLEILDLAGNYLTSLPPEFSRLQKLKIVFLSDNDFTVFPSILAACPMLEMIGFKANKISVFPENSLPLTVRWLILTNNSLNKLPQSIGYCTRLQKVMLAGNKLTALPDAMAQCVNLELLRISANQINELPSWLFTLQRLSWLAFGGNPCSVSKTGGEPLPEIGWHELELFQLLGEGASGIITKAHWHHAGVTNDVAVKVFKGEVTSDGLPDDEMQACLRAGTHPNLVKVLGKIADHPQQKNGLVFDLIPPDYKNLGGPPSFESCTRDTYSAETLFSVSDIVHIVTGVASAALHLHTKGILHGDLYAHNMLIDARATVLWGDFGAATLYDTTAGNAPALQRLDVRAYGCLLDDLLMHSKQVNGETLIVNHLHALQQRCLHDNISARPGFDEIVTFLDNAVK